MLETALVLAAAPVIVTTTVALSLPILLSGQMPFYRQRRVGRNGRIFVMWKLRSMVSDADARLSSYLHNNPDARQEWALRQKLSDDPRVTSFGRFLRKTSMDEIPQFWNVLKGDMALIGPRPMLPHQRAIYAGSAYYRLRPGISGFWQVSDRNQSEFTSRVAYDERYDEEITLATDIRLIFKTFGAVFRGTGV